MVGLNGGTEGEGDPNGDGIISTRVRAHFNAQDVYEYALRYASSLTRTLRHAD